MQRHAFPSPRLRNWSIFLFLTGPVGLLTLLAQETWPLSEPCPACGKRRLITLERCGHCGAPWPEPARDGTEIVTV